MIGGTQGVLRVPRWRAESGARRDRARQHVGHNGGVSPFPSTLRDRTDQALADLSPGYFALVMATGIVSIGCAEAGLVAVSVVLLVITALAYVVLAAAYIARSLRHPGRVREDQRSPQVAFSYFTIVAGTDVLAVRLLGSGLTVVAVVLLVLGAALWLVFGYVLPWQVFMTRDGQPILARTNGTWFIWSVASQSLAVGMAVVHPLLPQYSALIGILAVLFWSVGTMLYIGIAFMVALRLVHFGITAEQFEAPYWVSMGALAIAVVAGSSIVGTGSTPMIDAARSVIGGSVVIFWCFAAWLIPALLAAGFWRHLIRRIPLRYSPALWSMVFPLGMFAVASMRMGTVEHLPAIAKVGTAGLGVAGLVWLLVLISMLVHIARGVLLPHRPHPAEVVS